MNMTRLDLAALYQLALTEGRVRSNDRKADVIAINDPDGETWEVAKTAVTGADAHPESNVAGDEVPTPPAPRTDALSVTPAANRPPKLTPAESEFVRWLAREALKS